MRNYKVGEVNVYISDEYFDKFITLNGDIDLEVERVLDAFDLVEVDELSLEVNRICATLPGYGYIVVWEDLS